MTTHYFYKFVDNNTKQVVIYVSTWNDTWTLHKLRNNIKYYNSKPDRSDNVLYDIISNNNFSMDLVEKVDTNDTKLIKNIRKKLKRIFERSY